MASYQSGALQSAPGYAPRKAATAAFTPNMPQIGTLPTVPGLAQDASTPGYVNRQLLSQQLGQLPAQQQAAFTGLRSQAQQALAGYGGYQFQQDNPTTPQDESLLLNYDSSKGLGEKGKAAYKGAAANANAGGMLESSFANQNIASAVQRVSLEAQQVVNQYATAINQTATQFANQAAGIASEWAGLYGQDSAWLVQNPPPAPAAYVAPPGTVGKVWEGYGSPDPEALKAMYPGMDITLENHNGQTVAIAKPAQEAPRPAGPPTMTYADFLKGRKSTSALAKVWDAKYNGGRRFG